MTDDANWRTLDWDECEPFSRLGDPWLLEDGRTVEDILNAWDAFNAGAQDHGLTDWEKKFILLTLETQEHLRRLCAGMQGEELMVPRIHEFMMARHRSPAQLLEPEDAVATAERHMAKLRDFRDRLVAKDDLNDDALEAFSEYVNALSGLDIRCVDKSSATPGLSPFDGLTAIPPPAGAVENSDRSSDQEAFRLTGDDELAVHDLLYYWRGSLSHRVRRDEDSGPSGAGWFGVRELLAHTSDETHDALLDYVMAPAFVDPIDGEPFYRLWEGGASMWLRTDAIEVRTDWARRWPNSRYLD